MSNKTLPVALIQERAIIDQGAGNADANLGLIEQRVAEAARQGAKLVLLQEIHNGPYFCQHESVDEFDLAEPIPGPSTERLGKLAKQHGVVLVSSLFERRAAGLYHNTAVVLDADGSIAGKYRKMHIPDDPGFYEKFYFTPGDLGFEPIDTSVGRLGVLVCWDQWYPEAARLMALAGAELLLYPTAIGFDPDDDQAEKNRQRDAWIISHRGHAVANGLPVLSCNRVGHEPSPLGRREWTSGATATCWDHRGSFSPRLAVTRKSSWLKSTCNAARTSGGSGRSCVIAASMPMATCSNVTGIEPSPAQCVQSGTVPPSHPPLLQLVAA